MSSDTSLPYGVEVLAATSEQEPVLANLLELYAHDFSEFSDFQLQEDGRFGYPLLSRYWQEESRFPFLVRVDGQLAGFALVSRGSRISEDPGVWDMAEFFIVRRYRKRRIGASVAREIWRRFPGAWEVRVIQSNQPAYAFWRATVRAFDSSSVERTITETPQKRWHVFSFVSAGAAGTE